MWLVSESSQHNDFWVAGSLTCSGFPQSEYTQRPTPELQGFQGPALEVKQHHLLCMRLPKMSHEPCQIKRRGLLRDMDVGGLLGGHHWGPTATSLI